MLFVVGLAPWGCGDDNGGDDGGEGGSSTPCDKEADCDDGDPCTHDFCLQAPGSTAKTCQNDQVDDGSVPADTEQTEGDCQLIACQNGEVSSINDNGDLPEDPDGNDCTDPACVEGEPTTADSEIGSSCQSNGNPAVCSAGGVCSCAAPSPDARHFVDPINGSDVPGNGGAQGACAYATIQYALTQATDEIRLADEDITATSEFPIVLTGNQWLNCPYDQDTNARPALIGSGDHMGSSTVVAFTGSINGIEDCELDAAGADYAVMVTSAAMDNGHFLTNAVVHGALTDGVWLDTAADNVSFQQNTIRDNGGIGIDFGATATGGSVDENNFSNNTGGAIACGNASPRLTGAANVLNGGACTGCQNCPFDAMP